MSGRKYVGEIVFNQNIDQYSKSKKESLKREIYDKIVSNEYFIKNIELGGGHFLSHKNKTIKLKGDKAFVSFKEIVSIFNDTYKKRSKDKSMFNWAQKNFKKSMNFNKKMFLDDSLKAVKISVKKDNKTQKKTRKRKKTMNGGVGPLPVAVALGAAAAGAYGYKKYRDRKRKGEDKLLEDEATYGQEGFTVQDAPDYIPDDPSVPVGQSKLIEEKYGEGIYEYRVHNKDGEVKRGYYKKILPRQNTSVHEAAVQPEDKSGWYYDY